MWILRKIQPLRINLYRTHQGRRWSSRHPMRVLQKKTMITPQSTATNANVTREINLRHRRRRLPGSKLPSIVHPMDVDKSYLVPSRLWRRKDFLWMTFLRWLWDVFFCMFVCQKCQVCMICRSTFLLVAKKRKKILSLAVQKLCELQWDT
jgi:hypothetical protein